MRAIYLDNCYGHFHPCDVVSLKYNALTKKYILYYYDQTLGEHMYAYLKKVDGEFFITDYDFRSFESVSSAFTSPLLGKADITQLPPFIKSINRPYFQGNEVVCQSKTTSGYLKKKIDFIEIESYEDALNGVKYYYFIVQDMIPRVDGFKYLAKFSCESSKRLKKNIIAKHKLECPIQDIPQEDGVYTFDFGLEDKINVNMEVEALLVKKIMELNKGKRDNMDPVLLTKVVRMILRSQDRKKAALEYQQLLSKYYDKWVEEKKEKHL